MTLGSLLPLVLLVLAAIELSVFLMLRQRGTLPQAAFVPVALASAALPLVAYAMLNLVVPEIGAMEVLR